MIDSIGSKEILSSYKGNITNKSHAFKKTSNVLITINIIVIKDVKTFERGDTIVNLSVLVDEAIGKWR